MSQAVSFANDRTPRRRSETCRLRSAAPSWTISLLLHGAVLGCLATVTWKVHRSEPDREFSVGIVLKQDTPDGQMFETQDRNYAVG